MNPKEIERYSRQLLLPEVGKKGQEQLLAAKVLVIGAGGLGCPILQYLVGAGIGTIGIIDDDVVSVSNLHRQILYGVSSVGTNKAEAAKDRLSDLNPDISIVSYTERLTTKNALQLFSNYDIIVDGSDNFSTRYLVNDACILTGKPLVYGAIYKFQGQVAVFNYQEGPSYRCLFPDPPAPGDAPSCSEIGVIGVLPGIIGTLQANEVIKIILNIGKVTSGNIQLINTLNSEMTSLKISKNQEVIDEVLRRKNQFEVYDYDVFCGINPDIPEITFDQALQLKDTQFIDVREPEEQPKIEGLTPLYIPLNRLEEAVKSFNKKQTFVCFCQSGIRSKKATEQLIDLGFENVYNLKQGAPLLAQVV